MKQIFILLFCSVILIACDKNPNKNGLTDSWQRLSSGPILYPGHKYSDGRVDIAIADPSVVYDESEKLWKLWYSTTRLTTLADDGQLVIKYAESSDGVNWTGQEEPVLVARNGTDAWDATTVETPDVIINPNAPADKRFMLFYAGADETLAMGFDNYKIGLAYSRDGRSFTRISASDSPYGEEGLLMKVEEGLPGIGGIAKGILADPDVVYRDGTFHLYYSSFACSGACSPGETLAWGISHATSQDGLNWTADNSNPIDNLPAQQPSVVWNSKSQQYEMWITIDEPEDVAEIPSTFNQTLGFWRATSKDAVNWQIDLEGTRDFIWDSSSDYELYGLLKGVEVVQKGNMQHLFYVSFGNQNIPDPNLFFVFVRPDYDSRGIIEATSSLSKASRLAP